MRFYLQLILISLILTPALAQAEEIQVGIGPSQVEISVGKDGLPVTVAPTLTFGAPDEKRIVLQEYIVSPNAPRTEYISTTTLSGEEFSAKLPFTFIPTILDATGTYNYEWRFRLETATGNVDLAIPFKVKLNVVEHEKDIEAPYLWYPINTTYTSPLASIDVPRLIVTQREKDQRILIHTDSTYPRKIANITLTGTLSNKQLGELSATSTVAIDPSSTGTIPFTLPALPLGKSTLRLDLLDTSDTVTILTLPTHNELGAFTALLASLLAASLFISKKKQK